MWLQTKRSIPWWFSKGIPGYLATEERGESLFAEQVMVEVGLQGKQLSLNHLPEPEAATKWPSYRTALSFLLFLHHQYGEEAIQSMVKQIIHAPAETTFEEVIFLTYGKTLSELEAEWITAVKKAWMAAVKKAMPTTP